MNQFLKDKIKKAISVLEVNKITSASQKEFVEAADMAIKALTKQLEMLEHCEGSCVGCPYVNEEPNNECMHDFIID